MSNSSRYGSFAQIRNQLTSKIILHATLRQPSQWETAPSVVFHENKEDVENLLSAATKNTRVGVVLREKLHLDLDRAEEETGNSRARILAILLFADVRPSDPMWTNFISLLHSERLSSDLSDQRLPLDVNQIAKIFGRTGRYNQDFERLQWQFMPSPTSHFQREISCLRDTLNKYLVICKVLKDEGDSNSELVPSEDPRDTFIPDDALRDFFDKNADRIKLLHIESEKYLAERCGPREQYEARCYAKQQSGLFLKRIRKVPKIFATLLLINICPDSRIWRSFTAKCLQPDKNPLEAVKLPFKFDTLRRHLDCDFSECAGFCDVQHTFCPIIVGLEERELIDKRHHGPSFRLHLHEKRGVGAGAYGRVYKVKTSLDKPPVAMKLISLREAEGTPNEWHLLKLLREQNFSSKCILEALAAVHVANAMLIHFELCDHDLFHYMTTEAPAGPADRFERIELLESMIDIAEALMHLHDGLKRNHRRLVCYHKDIKAENVLVKRDDAGARLRFFLTDLGIASIIEKDDDGGHKESLYPGSGPYLSGTRLSLKAQKTRNQLGDLCENIAPEARDDGRVSASTDIWQYGTLLADFAVWLLDGAGQNGLCGFRRARHGPSSDAQGAGKDQTFFLINTREGKTVLKEGVVSWYNERIRATSDSVDKDDSEKAWLYREIWWLLENWMLVCKEDDRKPIKKVYKRLCTILEKLTNEEFTPIAPTVPTPTLAGRPWSDEADIPQSHRPTGHARARSSMSTARSHRHSCASLFSSVNLPSELDEAETPSIRTPSASGISLSEIQSSPGRVSRGAELRALQQSPSQRQQQNTETVPVAQATRRMTSRIYIS